MRVSQRHDLARASLLALATPIGISSVALLILNDHVLKHIAPSAITDKLGDFAGLMFAPYVLLLAIGMLPVRFDRGHQRRVAQAAYVVVGTFFFALKASSVSAPVLVALLDIAVPGPVAIVVDPTDLIALVVLPGSYLMWIRAWSCMSPAVMFRVRQTTVAAFGVFALV